MDQADPRARRWDAVVVGAGHNGLTAAAYLAGMGRSVLVLEASEQVGGACTLTRPFADPGYLISPCAYVVGLLHPVVVGELGLRKHGYAVHRVDPHLWCPFEDGTALTLWDDDARSAAEVATIAPGDVAGLLRYQELFARVRRALREGPRDTWLGEAPGRAEIEDLLGHDPELVGLVFTISRGIDATEQAYRDSRAGRPAPEWCELYFHSAYDPSVAPAGKQVMSVFAQYAPYTLAEGTWDGRREEIGDLVIAAIERFAPGTARLIQEREVLGPPDIERRTGLSGGHIFQGECLPAQMWDRRFGPRTPIPGVYLCGAATHPGGGVIAANGRNAAMAVAADLAARAIG